MKCKVLCPTCGYEAQYSIDDKEKRVVFKSMCAICYSLYEWNKRTKKAKELVFEKQTKYIQKLFVRQMIDLIYWRMYDLGNKDGFFYHYKYGKKPS